MRSNNIYIGYSLRKALGILALILSLVGSAGAATWTVDDSGGADYTSIQDAIDNASAGDTILVYSGTYYENVYVNKQLILRGIDTGGGMPVVDAGRSFSAMTLVAGDSTLEGFTAINTIHPYACIYVNSNNNMIKNNTVSNGSPGIFLLYSNNNTVSGNNASNNRDESGIVLSLSNNNTVTGNIASNNKHGIDLWYSNSSTLSNNIISKNQDGIYLIYAYNNIVYNNYFNNTNNLFFNVEDYNYPTITYSNIWNISKTLGPNIIGSPYLGGNFWAYPNGTGFSQTCLDNNKDGLCDVRHILADNNCDYLPLAVPAAPPTGAPDITSFSPPTTTVTNNVGDSRTFSITTNQTVNVSWLIIGIEVFNESSGVTEASYTNNSAAEGTWNVTAVASNTNGTAMQKWIWNVTAAKKVKATIDIDPNTLNLKSKGKWITAYIELPSGYNVKKINVSTIKLTTPFGKAVSVDPTAPKTIGDYDGDGISDLMVKFNRANVAANLVAGNKVKLTVTGKLMDGIAFESNDTIRVIK